MVQEVSHNTGKLSALSPGQKPREDVGEKMNIDYVDTPQESERRCGLKLTAISFHEYWDGR